MWQSARGNGDDELRYACLHNDVDTVRTLCKLSNVNIEIGDSDSTTPLMLGCYYGHYNIVYELISNQNVLVDHGNNMNVSPLHYACEQQHIEIVRLLLDNNANINAQTKKGHTPLHYATITNNFEICKLLLLRGANKTIKDNYGHTPIAIARKRKYKEIIHLFKAKNNDHIRQLHNNNIQSKPILTLNSNHSIELEKERIMRGEISTLKDQLNEIQYDNDTKVNKLIKRIGFVEDYIQTLSVSVQNMLDITPKYAPASTLGNTTLSSNVIPHISTSKQQLIITKTPVETPMTELNTPISGHSTDILLDRDNENITIGLNTDYEYDLEDDECKNDRPDLGKIPSLRPEANSLELGGFSDYDGASNVYSTKTTTPRLQNTLSNITSNEENDIVHLNDPMSPIHEDDKFTNTNTKSPSPFDKVVQTHVININNINNNNNNPILKNKYNSSPIQMNSNNIHNHTLLTNNVSKSIPNSPFAETYEYNRYNRHRDNDGHKRAATETQNYEYDYIHHTHHTLTQPPQFVAEYITKQDNNHQDKQPTTQIVQTPFINDDDNIKYPDLDDNQHEEIEISEEEYVSFINHNHNHSYKQPIASRHKSDPMIVENKPTSIPMTIGMLGGSVSPETVDAIKRSAKHHEEMNNVAHTFQSTYYNNNNNNMSRNRSQSAAATDFMNDKHINRNDNYTSWTNKIKKRTILTKNAPFNKQNVYVNRMIKTPPPPNTQYNHHATFDLSNGNGNKKNNKKLYNDIIPVNNKKESKIAESLRNRKQNKKIHKTETVESFRKKKMTKRKKKKRFSPDSNVYTGNY